MPISFSSPEWLPSLVRPRGSLGPGGSLGPVGSLMDSQGLSSIKYTGAHWHFRYLDGGIKYQRKYSLLDLNYDILPTLISDILMV